MLDCTAGASHAVVLLCESIIVMALTTLCVCSKHTFQLHLPA